ncbi:uncharacterized protein STEHIDRAFT_125395 [Stereum hirsutum FP-91666 SS1]|uniref:uncharacterized protein n=1 Tax=Stereum hirsutum (strain FP-91666) TaxID=721885 RepID=UPI00044494ED|nr:uncharacterized protein STEHIDRAFT_125395 [Stereum hirsutum FP-91666 SS1]EIM81125.1 hypothetical protein STEHIDRAFT_125395 [Stereum hirsutum FP-91666 SS1]
MQASSLPVNPSSTTASGGSLGNNDGNTPKVGTATANFKPNLPPVILVILQGYTKEDGECTKVDGKEGTLRLMLARARIEELSYNVQEALEEIIESSGWRSFGAPGRLQAVFSCPEQYEYREAGCVVEKDWDFLIKHATSLSLDFTRSRRWLESEIPSYARRKENEKAWGYCIAY